MICKNCSAENEEGAKFCSNCGESFKDYYNINTVLSKEEDEPGENNMLEPDNQEAQNASSAPVPPHYAPEANAYYAPPVNDNPFGEFPSDKSGSYNAAPAQPFMNAAPPVQPMPPYPPQGAPYQAQFLPQTPPVYPPNPYGFPPVDPFQGKATAAKVCGILSIVITLISCGVLWIPGLILGIIGISMGAGYQNKVLPQNRSKARTGLICGIIGTAICIILFVLSLVLSKYMNSSSGQDLYRQFQEQFNTIIRPFIF